MTGNSASHDDRPAALALLGPHEPDRLRDARVRARCREALVEARRREAVHGEPGWRFAVGLALAPTVIGVLCAVYLFEVIARAMQLYRF
jgi:hypothetical protein